MRVTTWNDSIADVGDHTLIDPKSPLFDQTVLLKKNQQVLFSGSFIPDPTDCFREISMTLSESMDEPEFLFRFSDIAPVPYQIAPYEGAFSPGRRASNGDNSTERVLVAVTSNFSRTGRLFLADVEGYASATILAPDRMELCYLKHTREARVASCTELIKQA